MRPARVFQPLEHPLERDSETPLFQSLPPALPTVVRINKPGPLLKAGAIGQRQDVQTLDFIEGYPRDVMNQTTMPGQIGVVSHAVQRLVEELLDLQRLPSAVLVSPAADPFPPLSEIQQETTQLVEALSRLGIESWLMTRGFIRPAAMEVLQRHAGKVKVTVGLTTLDRRLQRVLEPLYAPPNLRLKTMRALRHAGIACNACLDPLIPCVTDTRENLLPVLEAIAQAGVKSVTVGYLVLHQRMEQPLQEVLRPLGLDTMVMEEYAHGRVLHGNQGLSGRCLPRGRRQHGYAAVMAMAANFGLRVSVNGQTNPDFARAPVGPQRVTLPALHLSAG